MDQLPPGVDLFKIPWAQPPPGRQSNFNGRSDLVTPFVVVISIMISFMVIFGSLRIIIEFGRDEKWRLEDWCSTSTMVLVSAYGPVLMAGCPSLGQHTWDVSLGFLNAPWPQKMLVTIAFMLCMCLFLGKICLLLLYYRFFKHMDHVRYQIYAAAVLTIPILAAGIALPIQAAPPLGKPWGTPNPLNKSNMGLALGLGVVNLVVDLIIFFIPIPVVLKMNLDRKTKAGVMTIFLTGSIALVADIVVMYFRVQLFRGKDGLRFGLVVGLCSFVEAAISVICCSMPSAAKFYKVHIVPSRVFISLRSRFHSSKMSDKSSFHEVHDVAQKEKPRRVKGPYSIPTTHDFSVAQPSRIDALELGDVPEGYMQPRLAIEAGPAKKYIEAGRIQKDVSWEQKSQTYSSSSLAKIQNTV